MPFGGGIRLKNKYKKYTKYYMWYLHLLHVVKDCTDTRSFRKKLPDGTWNQDREYLTENLDKGEE